MIKRLLTIKDIMEIFQITRPTVYAWMSNGKLKAYRPSVRAVRFKEEEVEEMLQNESSIGEERKK